MKMTILQNLQYTVLDLDNNNNCQYPDQWCSGKFGAGGKINLEITYFSSFLQAEMVSSVLFFSCMMQFR